MESRLTDEIIEALKKQAKVNREGKGWRTRCPNPGHEDLHPSFFLYPNGGGRCFSQCNRYWSPREMAELLGIQVPLHSQGLIVAQLAEAKGLTTEFLRSIGITDGVAGNRSKKTPCVDIPYPNEAGKIVAFRKRLRLEGNKRFIWRRGDHPTLYGLNRIEEIRQTGRVILVEGESDTWVLWSQGLPALGVPGASMWKNEFASLLYGLTVYLWREPDASGNALLKSVSADLPDLRVIEAPKDVKDPSELYLQDPAGFRQVMEELTKAAQPVSQPGDIQLPEIVISNSRMRDTASESWSALLKANDPPVLFQRGHTLVELLFSDSGVPFGSLLDRPALRGRLDRAANFGRLTDDGIKPARPPNDVVADMMAAPQFPLPVLRGIAEAPMFTPPDVLVSKAGYHQDSHFYLHLVKALDIPAVPDYPDVTCLAQARSLLLDDLLVDFPFVDDADRTNAVAVLLLPFVRLLIEGPTPLHLIESPTPGSGKGLLTDVVTIPAIGRGPAVMTEGRDEDEWRKRLTAKLLLAPQFILIDNVRARLDSAALSAALTSKVWEDRLLGHSQTVAIPVTCTWLATANNPALSLEITRRAVSIRLDATVERPWERTGFKHPDIRRWTREHRGELVLAALTMIKAWIAAGKPRGEVTLGSYESWSDVIGGILEVVGIPGFLTNSNRVYEEAEHEMIAWREFYSAWWQDHQGNLVTADILFRLAKRNHLLLDVWAGRGEHAARTRFGMALTRMRDRIIGAYQLQKAGQDSHNKVQYYRLEPVQTPAIASVAGVAGGAGGFQPNENSSLQHGNGRVGTTVPTCGEAIEKNIKERNNPRNTRNTRKEGGKRWEIEI